MALIDNLNDNTLLRFAFGWNYKSWSHALRVVKFQVPNKVNRILEIGAGELSVVSLIFDGFANEIVISYYSDEQKEPIEKYLDTVRKNYDLKSKYVLKQIDATTVNESFDIVIMKSVLGGIFRENSSTISDARNFIASLVSRAVEADGLLISIDNGKSILERLLSRFGGRKNHWRFFRKLDLNGAIWQNEFGVISSFSFETRLGYFGYLLDNYLIYPLDRVLFKVWCRNPTVIVSVFHKDFSSLGS